MKQDIPKDTIDSTEPAPGQGVDTPEAWRAVANMWCDELNKERDRSFIQFLVLLVLLMAAVVWFFCAMTELRSADSSLRALRSENQTMREELATLRSGQTVPRTASPAESASASDSDPGSRALPARVSSASSVGEIEP